MGAARRHNRPQSDPRPAATRPSEVRRTRSAGNGAHPLEFTIPSVLSATRDVHKRIMDEVERHKYDEESLFAIRLALEEGLMNAVKHGNKLDSSKTVHVEANVTDKSTEIIIEDQGKGFARADVPDPCAGENLLKCSGRGILLMESYMDKVQYSNGGRRVRMVKKNS